MMLWSGGWIGPTWEQFLSLSWYLTYPLLNNHLAVNDTMLLISGKMALTQQSTGIGGWFLAFLAKWRYTYYGIDGPHFNA